MILWRPTFIVKSLKSWSKFVLYYITDLGDDATMLFLTTKTSLEASTSPVKSSLLTFSPQLLTVQTLLDPYLSMTVCDSSSSPVSFSPTLGKSCSSTLPANYGLFAFLFCDANEPRKWAGIEADVNVVWPWSDRFIGQCFCIMMTCASYMAWKCQGLREWLLS